MLALTGSLKRRLSDAYLAGSAEFTHRAIRGRFGNRDFRRVIIVSALGRRTGIASGARLQWEALRQLGMDAELLDATRALHNPLFRIPHRPGSAYIFHAGGPQTASLIGSVLPHGAEAYRVAYWAWELPDPPAEWMGCDRAIDEIWTPSAFSKASLTKLTNRPIHVVPHRVRPAPARSRRNDAPFTVLAMADSRSSLSRKNPEGALYAFRKAFGASRGARLVLKLSGRQDTFPPSLAKRASGGNIETIRTHLDDAALTKLYQRADVFLSLHRAEGFGLPMLEAMSHGVPVVATDWSGNREFMDPSNSHLVPCRLVPVNDASAIYAGSVWAEPDLDAAAHGLRRLAEDAEYYARLAAAAHRRAVTWVSRFPFAISNTSSMASPP